MIRGHCQSGRLSLQLRTGALCTASYALRNDGRLFIRCRETYTPITNLSPRCDSWFVQAYAEALLRQSLLRMGLL
jgi:hypothetical protein